MCVYTYIRQAAEQESPSLDVMQYKKAKDVCLVSHHEGIVGDGYSIPCVAWRRARASRPHALTTTNSVRPALSDWHDAADCGPAPGPARAHCSGVRDVGVV